MRISRILVFFLIGIFFGCTTVKVNRGVTDDNVYYSANLPKVRIGIDKRFVYSPKHPVTKENKCEFFLDEKTNESVFIKIYHDDYAPEKSFSGKNMVSVEKKNILGKIYYVGTEIFKDNDGYYIKRVHLNYPNNRTMLVVMHTRPLRLYNNQYDWSDILTLTEEQKQIIAGFVIENVNYVRFIE